MNDLRKRAEDLLTRVELTPQAVDAMVAFAAERVAAERDASKETAERNKWMCEAMQEEIARLREDAANWKRAAEYQYLQLRIAKYGPDEKTYPVEGALDAWFGKTYALDAARKETK